MAVNTSATRTATRSLALGSVFLLATTVLASSTHGLRAIPRDCPSTAALGPPSRIGSQSFDLHRADSPAMPVGGAVLRAPDASRDRATVRLTHLAAFVESMQEGTPAAQGARLSTGEGATLFATFCATCHGRSGRGDGPMAAQLRRMPPDLTALAFHNGDRFPRERVRQIVTGTGPAAHGDRTMPVWGDAFNRLGDPRADAEARIDAIVRYLELLQQRRR